MGLTYYQPNISGVTQYAVILAEELVKRKHKVTVLTSRFKNDLKERENINGVGVVRIEGIRAGKGFVMPSFWWRSIKEVKKTEIVNCHLPSVESFWLVLWGKIFGKKIVITHHCEFGLNGNMTNFLIGLLTYFIHIWVYLWADVIVSYTQDYAKTSIFLRNFLKKIVYILPPIKVEETKKNIDLGKGKVVGFVGRIGWEKGLEVLVEAMKNVKAKLVLVGPYKEVAGDTTHKKLTGVELYGPIDHKDLKAFYTKCECLVLPSTNNLETFGIVQVEAMRCGCPVVASDLPGVRVPVRMTDMGEIAKVGDVADLVKKINLVLKNGKSYYQKIAKNLEKFDYRKTVDEYENIFNN